MDALNPSSNLPDAVALLFTNNVGQVIFVDQAFLKLMNYAETATVAGEPLFKALRLDSKIAQRLLDNLVKKGRVDNEILDLPSSSDPAHRIVLTAVANYDQTNRYLGADITLRATAKTAPLSPHSAVQVGTVTAPPRQISPEAMSSETIIFVQLYFTSQTKGMYVLLSRLVGVRTQANLDKIISDAARERGHAVQIKNGLFTSALSGLDAETYRDIWKKVLAYAVNIIGKRVVEREIQNTDATMHEGVLVLANQAGLRNLLSN